MQRQTMKLQNHEGKFYRFIGSPKSLAFKSHYYIFSRRFSTTLTVASFFSSVQRAIHFFCSFVQLLGREVPRIFWGLRSRFAQSRTEPQIFYASKSRGETKGPPPLCGFFSALCDIFPKIFEIYQRVPP